MSACILLAIVNHMTISNFTVSRGVHFSRREWEFLWIVNYYHTMLQASQLGEHCFEGKSISGCHATGDSISQLSHSLMASKAWFSSVHLTSILEATLLFTYPSNILSKILCLVYYLERCPPANPSISVYWFWSSHPGVFLLSLKLILVFPPECISPFLKTELVS